MKVKLEVYGPQGSGKSTFTRAFMDWLTKEFPEVEVSAQEFLVHPKGTFLSE